MFRESNFKKWWHVGPTEAFNGFVKTKTERSLLSVCVRARLRVSSPPPLDNRVFTPAKLNGSTKDTDKAPGEIHSIQFKFYKAAV